MITMVGTGVIINIQNKNKYKIVTLDEKINELKNLKVIDLTGNSLSDLPK